MNKPSQQSLIARELHDVLNAPRRLVGVLHFSVGPSKLTGGSSQCYLTSLGTSGSTFSMQESEGLTITMQGKVSVSTKVADKAPLVSLALLCRLDYQ